MKYEIDLNGQKVTLEYDNMGDYININELTTIDSRNINGQNDTISSELNMIGLLKGEAESAMALSKLDEKIYVGKFISNLRKQAAQNGGKYNLKVGKESIEVKLTEKALETCYHTDKEWIELKKDFIQKEKVFNALNSLYWSVQDKSNRLNPIQNKIQEQA